MAVIALSIALVLVAALAWDAYRRTLALRRVDELDEMRHGQMDLLDKIKAKADRHQVDELAEQVVQLGNRISMTSKR